MQLLVQLQAAYLTDLNELPQEQKKNWIEIYGWYPVHANSLIKSELYPKVFPSSKYVRREADASNGLMMQSG